MSVRTKRGAEPILCRGNVNYALANSDYRFLFENNPHPMWIFDEETLHVLEVNVAAASHFGYTRDELLSMTLADIRVGEDLARLQQLLKSAANDQEARSCWKLRKKGGALADVEIIWRRMTFNGRAACFALIQDVTAKKKAELALRESEQRFRGIYEHAATGIAIIGMDGRFEACNPAFTLISGYSENELRELYADGLVHFEDRQTDSYEFGRLVRQRIPSYQLLNRCIAKNGKYVWVSKYVSLLRDAAGTPAKVIALVTDMNDRKRHEEHIRLLMREVNHRSKNMLAIVHAVAKQTASQNSAGFVESFGERLRALAAAQDLLINNEWKGVELRELVCSQLAHFKDLIGKRIEFKGPSLAISTPAAQTIGMALHELATNAGKYGALSKAEGRVEVKWSRQQAKNGEETFLLSWRERGGPPVIAPARKGFGSTVILGMVMSRLNAKVKLDFAPAGLTWRLKCPAFEVMAGPSAVAGLREAEELESGFI